MLSPVLLVLLSTLAALLPLSTDPLTPALPALATSFGVDAPEAQSVMRSFILGVAFGQLVYGALGDRFGRRPVLIIGTATYVLATFATLFAPSIDMLAGLRFVQALGAAAATVLSRAVVRDLLEREAAAHALALMGVGMGVGVLLAPVLGGLAADWLGWRGPLLLMALCGIVATAGTLWRLPETVPALDPDALSPAGLGRAFGRLLQSGRYLSYVANCITGYGGVFLFLTGASFVLMGEFGISAAGFGLWFAFATCGYITGSLISSRIARRMGSNHALWIGLLGTLSGGVLMSLLALTQVHHPLAVTGPMVIYTFGWGFLQPQAQAAALSVYPEMAGRASAMLGFLQMVGAMLAALLYARIGDGTALPLAASMAALALLGVIIRLLSDRRGRQP